MQAIRIASVNRQKDKKRELRRVASQRETVQTKMHAFFVKYDTSGGDEAWDDDELRKALIAAYPKKKEMVDDKAIEFVKSVADVSKNNVIDKDEVVAAVQAYTTYTDRKEEVGERRTLEKYSYTRTD